MKKHLFIFIFLLSASLSAFTGIREENGFYSARMPLRPQDEGRQLYLGMERITKDNIALWKHYIRTQSNPRAMEMVQSKMELGGNLSDGSFKFGDVLSDIDCEKNEVWVAYVSDQIPAPIDESILDYQFHPDASRPINPFAEGIKMKVSIVSSPEALITSHMGISLSLECARTWRPRNISCDLHSFAAKVMLMRNPERKAMINAPVPAMASILQARLPRDKLSVGTREMQSLLSSQDAALMKGREEQYKKEMEIYHQFPPYMRRLSGKPRRHYLAVAYEFMKTQAPVISMDKEVKCSEGIKIDDGKNVKDWMRIYDPERPETVWLTLDNSNRDTYSWMWKDAFSDAGGVFYIYVDLKALADLCPLAD